MQGMPELEGTFLGFDFGLKRIGVAVGQSLTQSARPLITLSAKEGQPGWTELAKIVQQWRPKALIVGLPLKMDGSAQTITPHVYQFVELLQQRFNLPVFMMDERLTTKAARSELFERGGYRALQGGKVDQVAAALILETWLEKNSS